MFLWQSPLNCNECYYNESEKFIKILCIHISSFYYENELSELFTENYSTTGKRMFFLSSSNYIVSVKHKIRNHLLTMTFGTHICRWNFISVWGQIFKNYYYQRECTPDTAIWLSTLASKINYNDDVQLKKIRIWRVRVLMELHKHVTVNLYPRVMRADSAP